MLKRIFLPIFLTFIVQNASACYCHSQEQLNNPGQLDKFAFVAHVLVTDIRTFADETDIFDKHNEYDIEIIDLFKGRRVNKIIQYQVNAIGCWHPSKGEEVIMFGKLEKDIITIDVCDPNESYRTPDGFKFRHPNLPESNLDKLRRWFCRQSEKPLNGTKKTYYKNGRLETQESYVNGKLSDEKIVWLPTGELYLKQSYSNDTLHGKTTLYFPTGQISEEHFYIKGRLANVSRLFYDTTYWNHNPLPSYPFHRALSTTKTKKHIQISSEYFYNEQGRLSNTRHYSKDGLLESESYKDPIRDIIIFLSYHSNGEIAAMEMLQKKGEKFISHFDEAGAIIAR